MPPPLPPSPPPTFLPSRRSLSHTQRAAPAPHPTAHATARRGLWQYSDAKVANRNGRCRDRPRGRFATPADFPIDACSPCSHVHVRRERLGFVPRFEEPFCSSLVPNPTVTIRNCCAAVTALRCAEMVARDVAAVDVNMGCPKLFSTHGGMVCSDCSCGPSSHTTAYGMLAHTIDNPPHPMTRGRSC